MLIRTLNFNNQQIACVSGQKRPHAGDMRISKTGLGHKFSVNWTLSTQFQETMLTTRYSRKFCLLELDITGLSSIAC